MRRTPNVRNSASAYGRPAEEWARVGSRRRAGSRNASRMKGIVSGVESITYALECTPNLYNTNNNPEGSQGAPWPASGVVPAAAEEPQIYAGDAVAPPCRRRTKPADRSAGFYFYRRFWPGVSRRVLNPAVPRPAALAVRLDPRGQSPIRGKFGTLHTLEPGTSPRAYNLYQLSHE